jgi:DNA-binding NarL/FixJ family response regulator
VNGFEVVFDSDNCRFPETLKHVQVNLILIDYDFGEVKCNETISKALSVWPAVRFLFLTDYKEECNFDNIKISAAILKNSSKKEFECRIRELVGSQISVQLHL